MGKIYELPESKAGEAMRRVRRNPVTGRYGTYTRTLRLHRKQTSIHGSHEAVLAKLHAWLISSYRQLRQSDGNYSGRAAQYRSAAAHVKKALDIMTGYSKP
jgi:hypothetical protein